MAGKKWSLLYGLWVLVDNSVPVQPAAPALALGYC